MRETQRDENGASIRECPLPFAHLSYHLSESTSPPETREAGAGETLECGGKRKRDTALAARIRIAPPLRTPHPSPPAIPSEGGVALTLPAALQGARRTSTCPLIFERWYQTGAAGWKRTLHFNAEARRKDERNAEGRKWRDHP